MGGKLKLVMPHGVMLVASVALYWMASRIDVDTGGRISPAFWPKTVIVFMALLCVYEIAKRLIASSLEASRGPAPELEQDPASAAAAERAATLALPENNRMLFGGIAAITAYLLAVPWTGFIFTTTLFLVAFPWVGGFRRPGIAAAVGVAGGAVLAVMFMRIAYISLPLGEGPFRWLSIAVIRALGVS